MKLDLIQIDAFTDRLFGGNPAAVVPLESWLPDEKLLAIASENNLSETAYYIANPEKPDDYDLRWFTPGDEVDLCGHATLATAYHLFGRNEVAGDRVTFQTRSGELIVTRRADGNLAMDLPAAPTRPLAAEWTAAENEDRLTELEKIGGPRPLEFYGSNYALARYPTDADIRSFRYNWAIEDFLAGIGFWGLIITAQGNLEDRQGTDRGSDFVSRFFAPAKGVPEDPVTGSAHCVLAPFWADRLGKTNLKAEQLSKRGGRLTCSVEGDRVTLVGQCAHYLTGTISL